MKIENRVTGTRINGFDALRTIAMWLGVVLHSLIVYKSEPEPNWPHDTTNYLFFDWLYEFIHIFRMPLFYLVAGFFSRMTLERSGTRTFVTQRAKRILIPFIVGLVIIVPLSLLPFHFNYFFHIEKLDFKTAMGNSLRQMLSWNGMAHLWFLYYLIVFYILAVGYKSFLRRSLLKPAVVVSRIFNKSAWSKIVIQVVILLLILFFFKMVTPPVYTGIRISLTYLLYYGVFFIFGWLLQTDMGRIKMSPPIGWLLFVVGTALSITRFFYPELQTGIVFYGLVSVETISLVTGITALFIHYFSQESKWWRYFSDASYWVYLTHIFFVAGIQVMLLSSNIQGWLRFPIVLLSTFLFTIVTYQLLVRYTVIGEYLHGKRIRQQDK
jgi:glucans biosynthesis protein C